MASATMSHSSFANSTVRIDDFAYEDCVFTDCVLEYAGGPAPSFTRCDLLGSTRFVFVEAASNLIEFLRRFHDVGDGFRATAEGVIEYIRTPIPPQPLAH
jgi:hypothetical protein